MKKILVDLERLRYPNSGIANVFRNLFREIQQRNNHGSLEIYYFGKEKDIRNSEPYETVKLIKWKLWYKFFERFSSKFDLIHVSHQLSSYFQKNYYNTIKIVTLHDLNFLHENISQSKRNKMLRKVNNNLKNADYIVCISEFVKNDFLKNKNLFTLKKLKDIFVIYNGIGFPVEREYSLGKYDFLRNKKYILNIGVLVEKKNQKILIEMLPFLEEDLVLVSSEKKCAYMDKLNELIKEHKLENRVHFLYNISEEEKYAVIQNCEAMCHTSIAEGFGIPPIEAMFLGKPVFLSKYTSLPEIGGDAAFYFEDFIPRRMADFFMEKMNFYYKNRDDWEHKLKDWVLRYDSKVMAENYLNLYKKILHK